MSGKRAAAAATAADEPEEDPPQLLARSTSIAKLLHSVDYEQPASDKPLDPKKTAVLFIEYQNAFMKHGAGQAPEEQRIASRVLNNCSS